MSIKQIRYFVSVYNSGSLTTAAKEQYVTVQAVSKAIANLEQELKGELFVRESRGVHPTPLGRHFFLKAESALREFDQLEQFARAYRKNGSAAELRLALIAPPFNRNEQARASIASFVAKNLGIETSVVLDTPAGGLEGLRSATLDALITVGAFDHPEVDCMSIGTVTPSVIMERTHPLACQDFVRLEDVKPFPIVALKEFDSFNDSIVSSYRRRRADLRFVSIPLEDSDSLLTEGEGLAFVAGIPALGDLHAGAITRPIAPEDAIAIPICLVSRKSDKSSSYVVLERWLASELILFTGKSPIQHRATVSPGEGGDGYATS